MTHSQSIICTAIFQIAKQKCIMKELLPFEIGAAVHNIITSGILIVLLQMRQAKPNTCLAVRQQKEKIFERHWWMATFQI